ncbi:hypothetical protein D9756_009972 [Leucocoprinus leucothites]|uniref:Uncharacterized protein n=1 Tax=Leucocoprinus leucothites TaxID=201217 RepID=A0A8H5FRU6_9AGAR|nr:hypothetical protein D9756_009972 [Leucoagaricus leucothites]
MSGKVITVNRFTFCLDHGNEMCFSCNQDFRPLNNRGANVQNNLIKKLGANFEDDNGFYLEERQPINIYAIGVKANATQNSGSRATGSCNLHTKADCDRCYDWIRLIAAEATGDGADAVRGRTIRS